MPPTNKMSADFKKAVWLAIIGAVSYLGAAYFKVPDKPGPIVAPPAPVRISIGPNVSPGGPGPTEAPPPPPVRISIHASKFLNGPNVAMASGEMKARYGEVLMNRSPYLPRPNAAEFHFSVNTAGTYRFLAKYASLDERPVTIFVNGRLITENGLGRTTECLEAHCQQWFSEGEVQLNVGLNILRLERANEFPLIHGFRLEALH